MIRFAVTLCLCTLIAGCGSRSNPNVKTKNSMSSESEYETLLESSIKELRDKTQAHMSWGLGSFDEWDVDQESGLLIFTNADGTRAECPVQIIGSFNTKDNTWLWAWDNPSILEPLLQDALKVKAYGEKHQIESLTARTWVGEESDAWAMTALAMKLCNAQGGYRGPADSTHVFMTFGKVKLSKPE
jgi:hypothetical protein